MIKEEKVKEFIKELKDEMSCLPSFTLINKKLERVGHQGELIRKDDIRNKINKLTENKFGDLKK